MYYFTLSHRILLLSLLSVTLGNPIDSKFTNNCIIAELQTRGLLATKLFEVVATNCHNILNELFKKAATDLITAETKKHMNYDCYFSTLKLHGFDQHLYLKLYLESLSDVDESVEIEDHIKEMNLIAGTVAFPCMAFDGLMSQNFFKAFDPKSQKSLNCYKKYASDENIFEKNEYDVDLNVIVDSTECAEIMDVSRQKFANYSELFSLFNRQCVLEKLHQLRLHERTLRLLLIADKGLNDEQKKNERQNFNEFYPEIYNNIKTCALK